MSTIDRSISTLGNGTVVDLSSDEQLFKLDSCRNNPILKPQDIGVTWHENGTLHVGAVFNGGAELFQGKVVLTPKRLAIFV